MPVPVQARPLELLGPGREDRVREGAQSGYVAPDISTNGRVPRFLCDIETIPALYYEILSFVLILLYFILR